MEGSRVIRFGYADHVPHKLPTKTTTTAKTQHQTHQPRVILEQGYRDLEEETRFLIPRSTEWTAGDSR